MGGLSQGVSASSEDSIAGGQRALLTHKKKINKKNYPVGENRLAKAGQGWTGQDRKPGVPNEDTKNKTGTWNSTRLAQTWKHNTASCQDFWTAWASLAQPSRPTLDHLKYFLGLFTVSGLTFLPPTLACLCLLTPLCLVSCLVLCHVLEPEGWTSGAPAVQEFTSWGTR